MLPALLLLTLAFLALTLVRVSGAQRRVLLARWPAVTLALGAAFVLARGAWVSGLLLGALAALFWARPNLLRGAPRSAPTGQPMDEAEARALLGVAVGAGAKEIRAAFRARMRSAHPDRGGSHDQAARLAAARDLLLRRGGAS